jgi:hypothetical protein
MKVRKIIATIGDYSHVVVDGETFAKVNGFIPELPYTTTRDSQGRGLRVFNVEGVPLYARKDQETGKTIFVMTSKDAQQNYLPLDDERAAGPSVSFAF